LWTAEVPGLFVALAIVNAICSVNRVSDRICETGYV
jgi:hypothetical protein